MQISTPGVWRRLSCFGIEGVGVLLQGDVKKVTDDVAALRPSIFAAVPRVLDRMKSGIEAKIKRQPGWKQRLFRAAYNVKRFMRRLGRFDFVGHLPVMCMGPSVCDAWSLHPSLLCAQHPCCEHLDRCNTWS